MRLGGTGVPDSLKDRKLAHSLQLRSQGWSSTSWIGSFGKNCAVGSFWGVCSAHGSAVFLSQAITVFSLNPQWWSPATVLVLHCVLPWLGWLTRVDIRLHRANWIITTLNQQPGAWTGCQSLRVAGPVTSKLRSCSEGLRRASLPGRRGGRPKGCYREKP